MKLRLALLISFLLKFKLLPKLKYQNLWWKKNRRLMSNLLSRRHYQLRWKKSSIRKRCI